MSSHDRDPQDKTFGFPFNPWTIQKDFMTNLYKCIDQSKVGVFESPTGTGKSLSLICGSLQWLRDHQYETEWINSEANNIDGSSGSKGSEDVADDEPAWVKAQTKVIKERERSTIVDEVRESNEKYNKELSILPKLEEARSVLKKKRSKPGSMHDIEYDKDSGGTHKKSKRAAAALANSATEKEIFKHGSAQLTSLADDIEFTNDMINLDSPTTNGGTSRDDLNDMTDKKYIPPVIYVCSRTHSQLSQFAGEIKKTKFENVHTVTLGSRKQTCLNPKISKMSSLNMMNEACTDLVKQKGCGYHEGYNIDGPVFKKYVHKDIHDIEEIVDIGQKLHCCPYYGTRDTVAGSEIVLLSYNLIFQKNSRKALGIDLRNAIVIVDEAHNVIDAITSMHSCDVREKDIQKCIQCLDLYIEKFKLRFKSSTLAKLRTLQRLLLQIANIFKDLTTKGPDSFESCSDFLHKHQLDTYNMFEIVRFIEDYKIAYKINSSSKANDAQKKNDEVKDDEDALGRPILQVVCDFLIQLTNTNTDGRILFSSQDTPKLRYTLLHPGDVFNEVVKEARSVILAGGTLKPLDDIRYQLLDEESIKRLMVFSCGHVVDKENAKVITITKGPTGFAFDFKFNNRNNPSMIKELGNTLANIVNITPAGIIVFFPSFKYMNTVLNEFKKNGIFDRLSRKKVIFSEPRGSSEVDLVLRKYGKAIEATSGPQKTGVNGAIMFSVVGGKMSEGINFGDDYGRLVVIVGLPFPNIKSLEIQEKMKYVRNRMGGDPAAEREYYENVCMKAINQSVGRVIRHYRDHAAIVLVDERFSSQRIRSKLPQWLQKSFANGTDMSAAIPTLAEFFRRHRSQ